MRVKLQDAYTTDLGTWTVKSKNEKFFVYEYLTNMGLLYWIVLAPIYNENGELMFPDDETDFGLHAWTYRDYKYMKEDILNRFGVEWEFDDKIKQEYIRINMIEPDAEDLQTTEEKTGLQN